MEKERRSISGGPVGPAEVIYDGGKWLVRNVYVEMMVIMITMYHVLFKKLCITLFIKVSNL